MKIRFGILLAPKRKDEIGCSRNQCVMKTMHEKHIPNSHSNCIIRYCSFFLVSYVSERQIKVGYILRRLCGLNCVTEETLTSLLY